MSKKQDFNNTTRPLGSELESGKPEPQLPAQIGRYKVLKQLGRGGMGTVYLAYDLSLEREVVVKCIAMPNMADGDEWRRRFRREVQSAAQLNHPHIVTIYDVDLDHEPPYVVMELLTGGTLQDWLQHKPLPWDEALMLLRSLAQALAYAHQKGIVHRDVKPANVMFAEDEILSTAQGKPESVLKLVDFGLARWQSDQKQMTQAGMVMGTPAYMSPEQASGEIVDGQTDIFALGIIMFEAIAGYNPLDKGTSVLTLVEATSDSQINTSPILGSAPLEVIDLIEQAIAKDRDQRYRDCDTLLIDLNRCLENVGATQTVYSTSIMANGPADGGPEIRVAGRIHLTSEVEMVLQRMFRKFGQVAVETEFNRGLSGSRVFRVRLVEEGGRAQLPAVIKVAPSDLIQKEWQAYRTLVEHTLPNVARLDPSSLVLSTHSLWGGLRYTLVGGGTFEVQSLYDYYQTASEDDLFWVLEKRLFEIMGSNWWLDNRANRAFQMQADYDRLLPVNLLISFVEAPATDDVRIVEASSNLSVAPIIAGDYIQLKGFVVAEIDPIQQRITLNLSPASAGRPPVSCRLHLTEVPDVSRYRTGEVIDSLYGQVVATRDDLLEQLVRGIVDTDIDLSGTQLTLPAGPGQTSSISLPNPLLSYQRLLPEFIPGNAAAVHGALNLEDIPIDPATREVSLIDFATVRHGHALHDLLRLETEVVIKLIPPALIEAGLPVDTIYAFYEQLHWATLYPAQNISPSTLKKPFTMLKVIRKMAGKCLFNSDDWREYYQGLVLYLLGALKFKNMQKLPAAPLPSQTLFWGAATMQYLLESPPSPPPRPRPERRSGSLAQGTFPIPEIVPPFGTMRPDSDLYIERAVDGQCLERIAATQAVTLFIQAPRQMGKSSLMRRVLEQAKSTYHKPFAFVDFQKFPEHFFEDEESFLIEFCLMIGDALGLSDAIDEYWTGRRTNIMKCSRYMSDYVIPQFNAPFTLAMDEVERMLNSPFRANFFGMLRTWHNDRVFNENFAKLTLFLSSSTEPYLFIDNPNQSPFNVAEVFSLRDFTRTEVEELNRWHNSPLTQAQVDDLMNLINGHPFLTRLALYLLTTGKVIDLDTLIAQATEDNGPFGDHLRHYLLRVLQKPELKQALAYICHHQTFEENQVFYRLKGAGLIKKDGKKVILRNQLYDRYFKEHLNV